MMLQIMKVHFCNGVFFVLASVLAPTDIQGIVYFDVNSLLLVCKL
jgi:hypothetical protein